MVQLAGKKRYKPLYKKFIRLRSNVQLKSKLFKFKKQKWKTFLFFLKKKQRFERKPYSHYHYKVSKFTSKGNSFQKKFKNDLVARTKFNLFYGCLLRKNLKKQMTKIFNSKEKRDFKRVGLEFFESRLSSVLYRSHFCYSMRNASQIISHGHIEVNGITVRQKSYVLKQGDLIKTKRNSLNLIRQNLKKSSCWPVPPKYLIINYNTLQIVFGDIRGFDFSTYFPFKLDVNSIITTYYRD
uniref:ribosomal protein S4 n=1 Tax=Haslea pseudostrearia TaxID=197756 RepID=UPI002203AC6E|nr:ribosomal protein S4 [Haslea pseudostrearia]UXN44188.1 ribosomal protein S4 [Haslea pseudostrearia]